mgnify:CR=1 FL=1
MGAERCIRDSADGVGEVDDRPLVHEEVELEGRHVLAGRVEVDLACLLYTSDAADERSSVDLGGRRILKKKNPQ